MQVSNVRGTREGQDPTDSSHVSTLTSSSSLSDIPPIWPHSGPADSAPSTPQAPAPAALAPPSDSGSSSEPSEPRRIILISRKRPIGLRTASDPKPRSRDGSALGLGKAVDPGAAPTLLRTMVRIKKPTSHLLPTATSDSRPDNTVGEESARGKRRIRLSLRPPSSSQSAASTAHAKSQLSKTAEKTQKTVRCSSTHMLDGNRQGTSGPCAGPVAAPNSDARDGFQQGHSFERRILASSRPIPVYPDLSSVANAAGVEAEGSIPLIARVPVAGERSIMARTSRQPDSAPQPSADATREGCTVLQQKQSLLPDGEVQLDPTSANKLPRWLASHRLYPSMEGRQPAPKGLKARSKVTSESLDPTFSPFTLITDLSQAGRGFWSFHAIASGSKRKVGHAIRSAREEDAQGIAPHASSSRSAERATLNHESSAPDSGADTEKDPNRSQPRKRQKRRLDGWQARMALPHDDGLSSRPASPPQPAQGGRGRKNPQKRHASPEHHKPEQAELVYLPEKPLSTAAWTHVLDTVPVNEPGVVAGSEREYTSRQQSYVPTYRSQQGTLQGFFESARRQLLHQGSALVLHSSERLLQRYCEAPNAGGLS